MERPKHRSVRLDQLLVDRGLAENRSQAHALVIAGKVRSADRVLDKPGAKVDASLALEVAAARRFVGRGGEKLFGVLERWDVDVRGKQALDVGASTGGFTQVLLERGAVEVIALDVGRGQLDWRLRSDPRVRVLEGVNARHLRAEDLPFVPALAVADVSFISLEKVLPAVLGCLPEGGEVVALVKPQFEVGKDAVGKGGVVRDEALHREVLTRLTGFLVRSGAAVLALAPSPILGAEGNREFFVRVRKGGGGLREPEIEAEIERVLAENPS